MTRFVPAYRLLLKSNRGRDVDTANINKDYLLDATIAVGYRVNSYQATQFRVWATQCLREYIIKGFALDAERLKEAGGTGFKKAWQESNYGTIIVVVRKMKEKVLQKDPKLLMWYARQ